MPNFWANIALELLQLNVDWFWSVDRDGQLVQWQAGSGSTTILDNAADESTFFSPDAIAVGHWRQFIRGDTSLRREQARLLHSLRNGQPFKCCRVACFLPHLGVRGWVRLTGVPIHNATGAIIGYHGVAQNITGQMLSERKVARMSRHNLALKSALERSRTGVFICNLAKPGWPIDYVNQSFSLLTGMDAESASKNIQHLLGHNIFTVAENGASLTNASPPQERVFIGSDDQKRITELSHLPVVQDGGGKLLVCLLRDITAQKVQHQKELQHQRLEALGNLAGGMAHEINNQLQPVMMNCEIIADALPTELGLGDLMSSTKECLDNISYIVRHTLQFARRNQISEPEKTCLNSLLKKTFEYLDALMPESITTSISLCPQDLLANVNATEFTQIITNLTNNAVHAMDGKGQLSITLEAVGLTARISIRDTGCGMNEATKSRIFEPFFTTKKQGDGTGLGLSVVHGLVTQWGGQIDVDSKLGLGTVFTITVPIIQSYTEPKGEQNDHYNYEQKNLAG